MKQNKLSKFIGIKEYTLYLINNKQNIDTINYIKNAFIIYNEEADMQLINIYLNYFNDDIFNTFNIQHEKLIYYDILHKNDNVKTYLEKLGLVYKKDYICLGDIFTLTPYTFKYCLLNSKNPEYFLKQFSIIENAYRMYTQYFNSIKNDKDIQEYLLIKKRVDMENNQYSNINSSIRLIQSQLNSIFVKINELDIKMDEKIKQKEIDNDEYTIV